MRTVKNATRFLGTALLVGFLACASPTLPLPPPSLPTVSVGAEPNTFHLRSDRGALPNALVLVVNANPALTLDQRVDGTFADEQGSWEIQVSGYSGDVVEVSQELGDQGSPTISVTLK